MTRFAFGGKCVVGRAAAWPVLAASAARASPASSPYSAADPSDSPDEAKKWRRVWSSWNGVMGESRGRGVRVPLAASHRVRSRKRLGRGARLLVQHLVQVQ